MGPHARGFRGPGGLVPGDDEAHGQLSGVEEAVAVGVEGVEVQVGAGLGDGSRDPRLLLAVLDVAARVRMGKGDRDGDDAGDGAVLTKAEKFGTVVVAEVDLNARTLWPSLGDFRAELHRHRPAWPCEEPAPPTEPAPGRSAGF